MPLTLVSLGLSQTSKTYSLLSCFSSPPKVKKPRGEKFIVFHGPGPTLAMDEVASCLSKQVVEFGEPLLALLHFQLPKQFVLLAPESSHFSLLVSQLVLKTILMALIHLPVFARQQLSATLFERTDGQSSVSAGHTKQHAHRGRADFHQCETRSQHPPKVPFCGAGRGRMFCFSPHSGSSPCKCK